MNAQELLARSHALLLDFDGPICSVFAGIPASAIADQLRGVLADGGHARLPGKLDATKDPFDVLRYAATLGSDEARHVEAAFAAHEVEAISSATATPGAHAAIRDWHASGRLLAIVSNNSAAAIRAYTSLHDLSSAVDYISARTSSDPTQLKPNPYLLTQAIHSLAVAPEDCVLVGDSDTDMQASLRAGVFRVGYANKPGKTNTLSLAGAQEVITSWPHR